MTELADKIAADIFAAVPSLKPDVPHIRRLVGNAAVGSYERHTRRGTCTPLTKRSREILLIIKRHIDLHGVSPSYETMQRFVGAASKSGIARTVDMLEQRGAITRLPGQANGISLTAAGLKACHSFNERKDRHDQEKGQFEAVA